jgi:hypothetical protein
MVLTNYTNYLVREFSVRTSKLVKRCKLLENNPAFPMFTTSDSCSSGFNPYDLYSYQIHFIATKDIETANSLNSKNSPLAGRKVSYLKLSPQRNCCAATVAPVDHAVTRGRISCTIFAQAFF